MVAWCEMNNNKQGRPEGWWLGCLWWNLVTPFTLRINHPQCSPLGTRNCFPQGCFSCYTTDCLFFKQPSSHPLGSHYSQKIKEGNCLEENLVAMNSIQFLVPMLISKFLAWGSANTGSSSGKAIIAFNQQLETKPSLALGVSLQLYGHIPYFCPLLLLFHRTFCCEQILTVDLDHLVHTTDHWVYT